jgi:Tfp pilus assembly protein PilX
MRLDRRRPPRREEGFALFLAMLFLLVLTILGVALMFSASTENSLSANETKVSKIFYAASSGIDYATARLASEPAFAGGTMPVGVSSHYGSGAPNDISVVVSRPVVAGHGIRPGDQIESHGTAYGTTQIVENFYSVTSGAQSAAIQATKFISAEIGVYPQPLRLPDLPQELP